MLERLARGVMRHRRLVTGAWIVLTLFGVFSASQVSKRWLEQFAIPGYSAYEANQRTVKTFGSGELPPLVAVFGIRQGDVRRQTKIGDALAKLGTQFPKARIASFYSTGNTAYVSKDRRTTFATIYPAGQASFTVDTHAKEIRHTLQSSLPGIETHLTGRDPIFASQGNSGGGPGVLTEALIGGAGALVILLFVFGTLPAVAMPLMVAIASILNTFTLVWILTYLTPVSIIVQFLIALVGLGVAIDYALLMIFRFREELAHGSDVETAVVETMTHAGRSVVVSGSTVAIGLVSMVILPVPVIRSIGIGGLLIPAVSVATSITLLPAMLSLLGHRINSLRVLPKRLVQTTERGTGLWARWARLVMRRPLLIGGIGLALVALLLVPATSMNPSEAQAKAELGKPTDDAVIGYNRLVGAGITPGVIKPYIVLVEHARSARTYYAVIAALEADKGIAAAAAPPAWRRGTSGLVEAYGVTDASARSARTVISRLQHRVLPTLEKQLGSDVQLTLGGAAPEERDFVHAVYGKFPYVLLFVIILTFILLMRAFRSVFLPLKAVILNLISLGAAFGIITFVFQEGHGAHAIWGVQATDSIISWIPLMIFAFLYGLSMDYEVFMLTRMREAYDETGETEGAVALGLERTGKLVTSAALVLMFAFFVLSSSPGTDIKQFGIGLAAGVIFDATVIRALIVPSIMRVAGGWNWWLPKPLGRLLLVREPRPARESA